MEINFDPLFYDSVIILCKLKNMFFNFIIDIRQLLNGSFGCVIVRTINYLKILCAEFVQMKTLLII